MQNTLLNQGLKSSTNAPYHIQRLFLSESWMTSHKSSKVAVSTVFLHDVVVVRRSDCSHHPYDVRMV